MTLPDANVLAGHMRCTQEFISKFSTLVHVRSCCYLHYIHLHLSVCRKILHRTSLIELVLNRFVHILNYCSYLQNHE